MAVWRTKAYEEFGFEVGSYSYARGKVDLFADLADMAKSASEQGDKNRLTRIAQYVIWAASQNDAELLSCVDLAFFLPVLKEPDSYPELINNLPDSLVKEKQLLIEDAAT